MSFLSSLQWRYATKKFDTTNKVSDADIHTLTEAIRMTPTSFGLQPYHFYIVSSQDMRDQIGPVAWGQPQISTCSHLLVFVARSDLLVLTDDLFTTMSGGDTTVRAHLKWYEDMVTMFASNKDIEAAFAWSAKQAYIAHGFALAACAEMQIDSCGMEGFDPVAVGTILGLPPTQRAVVMLPIGYRAADETIRPKVRFPAEELFTYVV